jgi:hypothetical protein
MSIQQAGIIHGALALAEGEDLSSAGANWELELASADDRHTDMAHQLYPRKRGPWF